MTTDSTAGPVEDVQQRRYRMLIDGKVVDARSGATMETINPSTGQVLSTVPIADHSDVKQAVAAAERAQPAWNELGVRGRRDHFDKLASLVEQHAEELAVIDAVDGGNPIDAMRFDVKLVLWQLRDYPSVALDMGGRTLPATPGNLHYTTHQPYGVVGRIVPFNHPIMFAGVGALAALIAGNTVVMKPAEQTPLSALRLGELIADAFPPGVWNIVTGDAAVGDAIVTHPTIKRLAFTGSTEIGRRIQQRAAETAVKHVSLELGGKNPMVVFPDVEVERAARAAVMGMNFGTVQGQSCGSTSRVFVHSSIYDDVVDAIRGHLDAIGVGIPYQAGTQMGPLVSARHHQRVMDYISSGRQEGATLVTGGGRPAGADLQDGYFLSATCFADVTMDQRIGREEIFGPVVSVFRWDDLDEVISQANGVEYGLTASVWTHDIDLAHHTADRLQAGYVWVNDTARHFWGMPFGGFKNSGTGREEAASEIRSYTETKSVHTILGSSQQAMDRLHLRNPAAPRAHGPG